MVSARPEAAKFDFETAVQMQQMLVSGAGLWYKARRQIRTSSLQVVRKWPKYFNCTHIV